MIGGFLGAGKTTLVSRLAADYLRRGMSVGIVTNDQAADLVDTQLLRELGFNVSEVAGSCFCCNFPGLQDAIDRLSDGRRPDIVLAEPVGSCTDLIATIALPMQDMLGEVFSISPYAVLIKPSHGKRILAARDDVQGSTRGQQGGFSPEAAYIFHKQLEEADILLLNRCDELSEDDILSIEAVLRRQYPDKPLVRLSAKTGLNVEVLAEQLLAGERHSRQLMDVDYDTYAAGEADLGWLNAAIEFSTSSPVEADDVLMSVVSRIRDCCIDSDAEIAHLKVTAECEDGLGVCNVVSNDSAPTLTLGAHAKTRYLCLTLNARVAVAPEALQAWVLAAVREEAAFRSGEFTVTSVRSFRPGRPVPTHRVTS